MPGTGKAQCSAIHLHRMILIEAVLPPGSAGHITVFLRFFASHHTINPRSTACIGGTGIS